MGRAGFEWHLYSCFPKSHCDECQQLPCSLLRVRGREGEREGGRGRTEREGGREREGGERSNDTHVYCTLSKVSPGEGELDLLEDEAWFERVKKSYAGSENSPSDDPHILAPGRGPRVSSPESPLKWRLLNSVRGRESS